MRWYSASATYVGLEPACMPLLGPHKAPLMRKED